jgi:hypothetical protein
LAAERDGEGGAGAGEGLWGFGIGGGGEFLSKVILPLLEYKICRNSMSVKVKSDLPSLSYIHKTHAKQHMGDSVDSVIVSIGNID